MKPEDQEERPPRPRTESATVDQTPYRMGVGNWNAFNLRMETVHGAAERWRLLLEGVERPWLCWNVDSDWCLVQQRLVSKVGWTPVVGTDPRTPKPALTRDAIFIDFNADFQLPTIYMHFPLEFAFLFAPRLAFWHSDLLVRLDKLGKLAELFAGLADGSMAAVKPRRRLSQIFRTKGLRFWELIGCTTRGASRSQFENGCGWWMNFAVHPNCPNGEERRKREKSYWDHGVGIKYWSQNCGGEVTAIKEDYVSEGHCTRIGNKNYRRFAPDDATRLLPAELAHNFDLARVCRALKLENFLRDE